MAYIALFSLVSFIILLRGYLNCVKTLESSKKLCFELFAKAQEVNMKIIMELVRNSQETLSTQKPDHLRNFRYQLKFLI